MSILILLADAFCVLAVLLFNYRRLGMLHPLSAYLFFHSYCFTLRAWEIHLGAPTMYSIGYSSSYEAITFGEIERALVYADIGLVSFAIGCWIASVSVVRDSRSGRLMPWKPIVTPIAYAILYVSIAVGTTLFFLVRTRANLDFGALSQYAGVTTMWPITCLIAIYFLNQKFWTIALPALAYLSVVSLQGFHRFMLVLPILSLLGVYLFHSRRRWPTIQQWIIVASLFVIFPSLKQIGKAVGEGEISLAKEHLVAAFSVGGDAGNQENTQGFLDQYAGFLTLCDRYGQYEYGKTYLAVLTLPIPRAWWSDKPGLGDHIIKRATPSRPYDREGRIITYLGQSYVNFGLIGVLLIPLLLSYVLSSLYERFVRLPKHSLAALTYIFVSSTFLQAYRDGLTSFILFGFVFNMPLIFLWIAHSTVPDRPFTSNMQRRTL